MRKLSLLFLALSIVSSSGFAQTSTSIKKIYPTLMETEPSAAGYSKERLQRIDRTIQQYVDKKWIAGATALIVHDGKIVYYKGIGYDDIEKKTPLKRDAIFRIA